MTQDHALKHITVSVEDYCLALAATVSYM